MALARRSCRATKSKISPRRRGGRGGSRRFLFFTKKTPRPPRLRGALEAFLELTVAAGAGGEALCAFCAAGFESAQAEAEFVLQRFVDRQIDLLVRRAAIAPHAELRK